MIKKYLRKIHLWLGLTIGLLVFIIAITGCIYAFKEEISDVVEACRFSEKEDKPILLPSNVKKIAENALPNKLLHSIKYYNSNRSIEVSFYSYQPDYYYHMYLNPYSGKVLSIKNMDEDFFDFILIGHMYLWLPREIGSVVVLIATLIFTIMVITGIVLWFPKNWKVLKQRIWFRWTDATKWKRKNWDLHGIVGFYICLFALIFIITGLVWVFPNFAVVYHKLIGGKKSMIYAEAISTPPDIAVTNPLDRLYKNYSNSNLKFASLEIHPPETDSSSILVVTNPTTTTYWKSDYIFHDQYNLQELEVSHIWGRYSQATNADKILRLNYDIHVGAVLGFTGKLIAFIASLFIASLPVTGFLIWYGRKLKPKSVAK